MKGLLVSAEVLAGLEGLISEPVGLKLAELAARVPAGEHIVEIGSYKGKSTCYLAAGSRLGNSARVTAVDRWDLPGNANGRFGFNERETYDAFLDQLDVAGVGDLVDPMRAKSVDAARTWDDYEVGKIGLLYIDGSHLFDDVLADWRAWSPFLAEGAVVVFDDYRTLRNPGVQKVVDFLIASLRKGWKWEFEPNPLAIGYSPS